MRTLVTGGTVVSMDPAIGDLDRADVLLEDGVIVEVAERIDAGDAEVIDASERIVLPGFVDTHRHTWQTAFRGQRSDRRRGPPGPLRGCPEAACSRWRWGCAVRR